MAAASELFHHHAFVDLETTGLDPASDRVIEVGALFIHEGRPVQRISRLFAPAASLPLSIRRLTGIDDAALAGQPPFEQFAPELRAALSGWTVVAHNASFERGFLAELLEDIAAPVLDSCELLHYLYPELDSYSLESMIRWTGVGDRAAHRALKDCEDTFAMLCRALDRCIDERRADDVAEVLECLAPEGEGQPGERRAAAEEPLVDLLARLAAFCRHPPGGRNEMGDPFAPGAVPRPPPGRDEPVEPTGRDALPRLSAEGGEAPACAPASPAEPRNANGGQACLAPQAQMAAWLEGALAHEGVFAVEPGGGAQARACVEASAAFARKNRCRVSLAVGTDSRLSSLLETELPALQRGRAERLSYSFLDEQQHYLCRRRASDVCRTERGMSHEERAPRAYLRAFLRRSATGQIGRLSHWFKVRYPLLSRLALAGRSEAATTLAGRCPHYRACFYHSAVARAREADLLLLRHSSVAEWAPGGPPSRHLVIDEAHRLEGALSSALSRELSDGGLAQLGDRLLGVGGHGGLLRALEAELPARAEPGAGAPRPGDGAAIARSIQLEGDRLGAALAGLFPAEETPHRRELLLAERVRGSDGWPPIRDGLLGLKAQLAELGVWFAALRQALPSLEQSRPGLERDLCGAVSEVLSLIQCAAEFAAPAGNERCLLASVEGGSKGWRLRSEPLHVSRAFGRLAARRSVVLSSAALSVGGRSPWTLERLGAGVALHRMPVDPSDGRPLVLLVDDSPRPYGEEFLDWAASRIGGIATFAGGRVMGIFSSQSRLQQMEDRLRLGLEQLGIEAVRVSRARRDGQGAPAAGRVLLEARSAWHRSEAVAGLACAFVDRLPIEPLSRPSVAAREALASVQDERYRSMPYRLPRALVLLRHWLSTCAAAPDRKMVVVIAHPGAPHQRDAVVEALDGYQPQLLPWSAARVRIYEALRPFAQRGPARRPLPSTAGL